MNRERNPCTALALALLVLALAGWPGIPAAHLVLAQGPEPGGGRQPLAGGTWSATGSLATARSTHVATLLPDGRVLVVGGYYDDGSEHYLASAEVYDPASGNWSVTGSLATGRNNHTATLLADGRVLVVGGYSGDQYLASAEVFDPAAGTWSATGSLAAGRDSHTATLLPDGRVLVVGGYSDENSNHYLASAEIYDPGSGTWSATGSLATGRCSHTATLLPDGRVLVVGGYYYDGNAHYLAGAEVYDPVAGTWSAAGSLATGRDAHTATLLPNGRVLVVGGWNSSGFLAAAELYDAVSGTWSVTGALNTSRGMHTATLLPDARVLVAGGHGDSGHQAGAEVYNPVSGTWSATGSLATAREDHTATLLPDGRALVVGGGSYAGGYYYLASAEIYDPADGAWSATGSLTTGRRQHTATLLPDGRLLVAGGFGGSSNLASAEVYDPGSGTWSATGSLATARQAHTATLLPNGRVLVAGGVSGHPASAEVYDPATGTWSATGSLAAARWHHTATLLRDGRVLVVGGYYYDGSNYYLASAEIYDPNTGAWTATGSLATGRYQHTATLLPDGRVLVVGGYGSGGVIAGAELYDPASGTWSVTGPLSTARCRHTATLLPDGRVLVAGGYGSNAVLAGAEVYDPGSGTWSATGALTAARDSHTATLLPGGQVLVAGGYGGSGFLAGADVYDPGSGTWSATSSLAVTRQSHTATLLPDGRVLVVGGYYNDGSQHYLAGAEIYDRGLGFQSAWRPTLTTATSPLFLGDRFHAAGSGFRGYGLTEASGGGTQNSATNYPLVQLRRLDNEQVRWLRPGAAFSATAFTSAPVTDFPQGTALVTVFVNGIPSSSRIIIVVQPSRINLPLALRNWP